MLFSSQGGSIGDNLPVGTIIAYTGPLNKIPSGWALCNGQNGTPNLTGRFLEGVTASPGTFKAAGLPNITATYKLEQDNTIFESSGAIYNPNQRFNTSNIHTGGIVSTGYVMAFDASRCSPIYKNDVTTVQPASYTVYYIIKIK